MVLSAGGTEARAQRVYSWLNMSENKKMLAVSGDFFVFPLNEFMFEITFQMNVFIE